MTSRVGRATVAVVLGVIPSLRYPELGFLGPMLEGTLESVASDSQLELPHGALLVPVSIWPLGLRQR